MELTEARERLNLYKLFASLYFTLPDHDFVCMLRNLAVEEDGSEATGLLSAYIHKAQERSDDDIQQELRVDRARLLNGAVKQGARAPYESSYRDTDTRTLLRELNRLYESWGYGFAHSRSEQSDHIAKELGFMQMFCEREVAHWEDEAAIADLRVAEKDFMQKHLGQWVLPFAHETYAAAQTDFYRAASLMLAQHAENEIALLGIERVASSGK